MEGLQAQWQRRVRVSCSPILVVDAETILMELPSAHFLHVVRNPWSAYADTKKRPVPLSLPSYMLGWSLNQYYALLNREKFPDRMRIVRTEDVLEDSVRALAPLCQKLGVEITDSLKTPSWNGNELNEVFPWGTIQGDTRPIFRPRANFRQLNVKKFAFVPDLTWKSSVTKASPNR